jgi:hypothetical protein
MCVVRGYRDVNNEMLMQNFLTVGVERKYLVIAGVVFWSGDTEM